MIDSTTESCRGSAGSIRFTQCLRGRSGLCRPRAVSQRRIVRQKQLEDRSAQLLWICGMRCPAADMHQATVLQHDFVTYPHSEPCGGYFFGGEEGLEAAVAPLRLHAAAGVAHYKPHTLLLGMAPVAGASCADQQPCAAARGID